MKITTIHNSTKIAYHLATKKVIHIDNADNGLSCNCECICCHERLEAVQGTIRESFFRHEKNKNCEGGQETLLHQLGKQILVDNNQIKIPKYGTINYTNAIAEKAFSSVRPDVTAIYEGQYIFFEIAVNHFIEKDKESFFSNGQHKCIEIDLSNADVSSYEMIKNLVLTETSNKNIYGWKQPHDIQQTYLSWIKKITIGVLIVSFLCWLLGYKKRKNA